MPYLEHIDRQRVHRLGFATNGAELNYLITYHINKFLRERAIVRDLRYADFAEALAAIEGAKGEFLRLKMWPYEDRKREENGDV